MAVEIDIGDLLRASGQVREFLDRTQQKTVVQAGRRALIRTRPTGVRAIIEEIKTQRNLRSTKIREALTISNNLKGKTLEHLSIEFTVNDKRFGLIEYVKGRKIARSQIGKSVEKRPKLKFEIVPGKTIVSNDAFIAKGNGGNFQVFRRRKTSSLPITKQVEPALANVLGNKDVAEKIVVALQERYLVEITNAINFQFSQERMK